MNIIEKNLYQQIHPARLVTDWTTGLFACYWLWQHELVTAIVIAFLPSLIVSLIVVRFVDLEKTKNSPFGRYFKRTYSKSLDLVRLAGFIVMGVGSWYHSIPAAAIGCAVIIITWTYGLLSGK